MRINDLCAGHCTGPDDVAEAAEQFVSARMDRAKAVSQSSSRWFSTAVSRKFHAWCVPHDSGLIQAGAHAGVLEAQQPSLIGLTVSDRWCSELTTSGVKVHSRKLEKGQRLDYLPAQSAADSNLKIGIKLYFMRHMQAGMAAGATPCPKAAAAPGCYNPEPTARRCSKIVPGRCGGQGGGG